MKRIFYINGRSKEAPKGLNETPPVGSKVAYNHKRYNVTDVVYYFECNEIHILLNL